MFNKKKIAELENQISDLQKSNQDLIADKALIKRELYVIKKVIENPPKYKVGQEMKDVIIIEIFMTDGIFPRQMPLSSLALKTKLVIDLAKLLLKKGELDIDAIDVENEGTYHYKIFDKQDNKIKIISQNELVIIETKIKQ